MKNNSKVLGLTPDPDGPNGSMNRKKAPKAPKGAGLTDSSAGKGQTFGYKGGAKGGKGMGGRKGC